ncbi:MAG: phosphatase PAP2 family protein [Promethearchaeota archaeon]
MVLIPGEEAVNIFLQSFSSPLLDFIFQIITLLGDELFIIFLLVVVFWAIEKRMGFLLAIVLMFSQTLNWLLKSLFALPRPYVEFPSQVNLIGPEELSFAFPSGHSQNIATIWPFLTGWLRNKWLALLTIILIILVPLSRIYLGVHYLSDVIGGVFFGLIIVAGYFLLAERLQELWDRFTYQQQIVIALLTPLVVFLGIFLIFPTTFVEGRDPGLSLGVLFGGFLAIFAEQRYINMETKGVETRAKIFRIILGFPIVIATYFVLSALFGLIGDSLGVTEGLLFGLLRFVRYAILAIIGIFICPLLFVKLEPKIFGEKK